VYIFVYSVWYYLFSGCLITRGNSFKFDSNTGLAEVTYHDFRSAKGYDEDDYSIEKDWLMLKESVEDIEKEFGEDVSEVLMHELFQEEDSLSGKVKIKVHCPKCFPSKQIILEYLHREGVGFTDLKKGKFETINDEFFFFIPSGTEIVSANGKIIETNNNKMIVWTEKQEVFEYHIQESDKSRGKSLLSFYLQENEKEVTE